MLTRSNVKVVRLKDLFMMAAYKNEHETSPNIGGMVFSKNSFMSKHIALAQALTNERNSIVVEMLRLADNELEDNVSAQYVFGDVPLNFGLVILSHDSI